MTESTRKANTHTGIRYALPGLNPILYASAILTALLVLAPIAYLAWRALAADGALTEMLSRPRTWDIIRRSLVLAFSVTFLSMIISLPLAWALERTNLPFKRLWTVLTTVPLVIPSYVGGFVAIAALGPRGLLQQWLEPLGVERLPEIYGFTGALITLTLLRYPFMLLPLRAALSNMDPSLEESSKSLGKGTMQTFLKVTLPQLRPALAGGCLLTAITALADFGAVSLLRYETFTWAIYLQYQSLIDRSGAASLSLVLIVIALALLTMEWLTGKKAAEYSSVRGGRPPLAPVKPGRWLLPIMLLLTVLALAGIVMPVSVLAMWLIGGLMAGEVLPSLYVPLINSLYVSAAGAIVTLAAAFPVVYLAVRRPSFLTSFLMRVSYFGFALPGIAVALALVFFGIRFLTPIYQTTAMLVAAYVILFLPVAIGPIRGVLVQLNPRLGEAASGLGSPPLRTMLRITMPLSRPGIAAGGMLTFLVAMRELPATLILSPIGFSTLATSIWSASSEAFFARAAMYSLALIAISSVPMAIVMLKGNGGRAI